MSRITKQEEINTLTWVAWFYTAHRSEFDRFMRYGTPSDAMIEISDKTQIIKGSKVLLPYSLNTGNGQKIAHRYCLRFREWKRAIPLLAYKTFTDTVPSLAMSRRTADAKLHAYIVAEAIFHRAASEFKQEIIFSQLAIAEWVWTAYGIKLSNVSIKRLLEFWNKIEDGPISIKEWGIKGDTTKSTIIRVNLVPKSSTLLRNTILINTSDEWLDEHAHAMTAVYRFQDAKKLANAEMRAVVSEEKAIKKAEKLLRNLEALKAKEPVLVLETSLEEEAWWAEMNDRFALATAGSRGTDTVSNDEEITERLLK